MLYAIAGGALTIAEVQSSFPTTRTLPQQQESSNYSTSAQAVCGSGDETTEGKLELHLSTGSVWEWQRARPRDERE